MLLEEACSRLSAVQKNLAFGELFSKSDLANKGRSGQLLELALGLNLSNKHLDFDNGELKSFKCHKDGRPAETIAITQILSHIEDLISQKPFKESWIFQKISNVLYVPIGKDSDNPSDWVLLPEVHLNLTDESCADILKQLEEDYNLICSKIRQYCDAGKNIHTISGKYLQIRSKDSVPYHPIFSSSYNRYISDKNYAFYFKTDYVKMLLAKNLN